MLVSELCFLFVREAEAAFPSFYLSSLEVREAPRAHSQSQTLPLMLMPFSSPFSADVRVRGFGRYGGLDGGPISDPRQGRSRTFRKERSKNLVWFDSGALHPSLLEPHSSHHRLSLPLIQTRHVRLPPLIQSSLASTFTSTFRSTGSVGLHLPLLHLDLLLALPVLVLVHLAPPLALHALRPQLLGPTRRPPPPPRPRPPPRKAPRAAGPPRGRGGSHFHRRPSPPRGCGPRTAI